MRPLVHCVRPRVHVLRPTMERLGAIEDLLGLEVEPSAVEGCKGQRIAAAGGGAVRPLAWPPLDRLCALQPAQSVLNRSTAQPCTPFKRVDGWPGLEVIIGL